MANKRSSQRKRKRFKVGLEGSPTFTIDVSTGGFCIEMMRTPPLGSVVKGSMSVNGIEHQFVGTVAWVKQGDPRMNIRGRIGVRFTEVGEDLKKSIDADAAPPGAGRPAASPAAKLH